MAANGGSAFSLVSIEISKPFTKGRGTTPDLIYRDFGPDTWLTAFHIYISQILFDVFFSL